MLYGSLQFVDIASPSLGQTLLTMIMDNAITHYVGWSAIVTLTTAVFNWRHPNSDDTNAY